MKRKRLIVSISVVACFLCIVGICVYNIVRNKSFWNVNAAQIMTIVVALCIAFIANQIKGDERKQKEHAEVIIRKIQGLVEDESFYAFQEVSNSEILTKKWLLAQRTLSNSIDVLIKYSSKLQFFNDAKYIEDQFSQYKSLVFEYINDGDYLRRSENELKRYADNIASKCDSIIFNLY